MNVGVGNLTKNNCRWREPQDNIVQVVKNRNAKITTDREEEYAGDDADEQNWKGIIIALLVIVAICGLVVLAVVLVTPVHTEEELGEPFTFDDLYNPEFKVQKFNAKWIRGRNAYVYRSKPDGDLRLYDVETNETTLIMRNLIFENQNTDFYLVSEDASYVLLAFDIEPVHRYSFLAKYVIYDPRSISESNSHLVAFPLSLEGEWTNKKLQYAGWSPSGHSLTFVWGNNLYFQSNPFTTPARVTDNKREPFIFNGLPDWLYEEEIFRSNVAHWLSDDCRHVAYVQFNDTNVPVARLAVFGDSNEIYERVKEVSYPKAGDLNPDKYPVAKLFIAETANAKGSHRLIQPPSAILKNNDYYITLVRWKDNAHLLVVWTNRAQNQTIITSCNVVSTDCHVNLVDTQNRGWTTIDNVMFTTTSQQFVTILPQQINENGSWKHIASISTRMDSDGTKTFLTHGRWDVMNIVGYNEINSTIYFVSTNGDPRHRHLFKLILSNDGRHVTNQPVCMTCSSSSDQCHFVSTQFSSTGRYYIQGCLGPSVPRYTLKSTADDDTIMVVEDNAVLKSRLRNKALPRKEYFNVTTDDGETLWGQMYLPRILNKDHITQYPLLVNIHETLGSQQVTEEFRLDWPTFMSSSENVICASVDGRGTSARGLHFLHAIFHRLGSIEVKDQIKAINFIKQYQYVDKEKISVWGSLYGGFIVSHLIADSDEHGAEVQCAAAVTPVTDWRYYNAAYSEKHMGTTVSTGNYRGYDNANVSSKAVRFKEKGFLLVHAMADENVHFQHSAQLMKALTEVGVNFQSQIYADLTHDQLITGSKTSRHLYRTLGRFLKHDCWFSAKSLEAKLLHVASETNKKQNMKS